MLQNNKTQGLRVSPKVQRLQRFGRPNSAGSIRVLQNRRIQGCARRSNQGSKVTTVWPTSCCSEHKSMLHKRCCCEDTRCEGTCVLQNRTINGCTHGSRVTNVWPTKCGWEHTHVCCRICRFKVASKGHGIREFGRSIATVGQLRVVPGSRVTKAWPTSQLLLRAYTCVLQRNPGCTRIAPKDQGLQGFARPLDASVHMCVASNIKPGLHPRVDMFQGSGRPRAAVSANMCAEEQ